MIAFTICANNYLAEALTLGDSLELNGFDKNNYFIFLVDHYNDEITYDNVKSNIIKVTTDMVISFDQLTEKYNIIELSTCIKPSIFKYLISLHVDETLFAYFDPDIYCLQKIDDVIEKELGEYSVLLTPHVLRPVPLKVQPFENLFLNYGIYNLGFIAVRAGSNTLQMLNWWEERTLNLGVVDLKNGFFVDQLWMNLVTVFFEGIKVTKHFGFNTAYWNLNERAISRENNKYIVNNHAQLVFFHFSSFDFSLNKLSTKPFTPVADNDALKELMTIYKNNLTQNNYIFYKRFKPAYIVSYENYMLKEFGDTYSSKNISLATKLKRFIPAKLLKRIANLNHVVEIAGKYPQ